MHKRGRDKVQDTAAYTAIYSSRGIALFIFVVLVMALSLPLLRSKQVNALRKDAAFSAVRIIGGNGYEQLGKQLIDHAGANIAIGTFEEAVDFNRGGTPDIKTPANNDAFVTKRNADGSYAWTKTFSTAFYDTFSDVAIDSQNNVYVTSTFTGSMDFNPGGAPDVKASAGGNDTFITKYSSNGTYVWTKVIGGTGNEYINSMVFDPNDVMYYAGNFQGTVDFNPGGTADNKTSAGNNDTFITRINADGSYGWTKYMGGTQDDTAGIIYLTSTNDVYLQSYYYGTTNFNPEGVAYNKTALGNYDMGITKFSSAGAYQWTKVYGTAGFDFITTLTIDGSDNIYFPGSFSGTQDFNIDGTADSKTSNGLSDAFVSKINANGTYGWTKAWGGTDYDAAYYVKIGAGNTLIVGGTFKNTVDFNGATAGGSYTSAGSYDGYIAKLDTNGTNIWTATYGGTGYDDFSGITVDSSGNIFVTGEFEYASFNIPLASGQTRTITNTDTSAHYQSHTLMSMNDAGAFTGAKITAYDSSYTYTEKPLINTVNDKLYILGRTDYQDHMNFDPESQNIAYNVTGDSDAFILEYDIKTYALVTGLASGLGLTTASDTSVNLSTDGVLSTASANLQLKTDAGIPLATVSANMTADRAWSTVTGGSDTAAGKSFVHNLTTQPGAASSFSLYVPKLSGSSSVFVCPGAASLAAVSNSCAGGYTLTMSKNQITEAMISGKTYFIVPNLTGTGALSIDGTLANTGMNQTIIGGIAVTLLLSATYFIRARFKYSTL